VRAVGGVNRLISPGFRIKPADAVANLHREPQDAALVEVERVWITGLRI
jgi:hypothetical protein